MFKHFRLARYRITIAAGKYGLSLPPYKGATFRGGFGQVFRRVTCAIREQNCHPCPLRSSCAYAYIFETAPPDDAEALKKYENVPRPFVIEPSLDNKTEYDPGETLVFQLLLIGHAIVYLPYFIAVFRELEGVGIGRGKRPFKLLDITATGLDREELIFNTDSSMIRGVETAFTGKEVLQRIPGSTGKLGVSFETPFWLKNQGKFAPVPEFHILFRQAMRRISALSYFHHDVPLEADYAGLAKRSRQVNLIENKTYWQNWQRYSRRQNQCINQGGLLGEVTYEGKLDEFLPWLALGEYVHVGKNTVFGLGKYRLNVGKVN